MTVLGKIVYLNFFREYAAVLPENTALKAFIENRDLHICKITVIYNK